VEGYDGRKEKPVLIAGRISPLSRGHTMNTGKVERVEMEKPFRDPNEKSERSKQKPRGGEERRIHAMSVVACKCTEDIIHERCQVADATRRNGISKAGRSNLGMTTTMMRAAAVRSSSLSPSFATIAEIGRDTDQR